MKREILFRGKRIDNGEWVEGDLILHSSRYVRIAYFKDELYNDPKVNPDTIGQFTGLTDKNGKKIFESDIVCCMAINNDHNQYGAITISPVDIYNGNTCVSITHVTLYDICISNKVKVIGNIHDNPELPIQNT